MKRGLGWFSASAAALTVLVMGLPQATAQPRSAGPTPPTASSATSPGQAGYFVTSPPTPASASDRFKVPRLACTSTRSAVALGSIIFTGSGTTGSLTAAELYVQCTGGAPSYQAVVVVNGAAKTAKFTPKVGDVIAAWAGESSRSATAVLKDLTMAKEVSASSATGARTSFVLDGVDSLLNRITGAELPVPNFGTVQFTAGNADRTSVVAAGGVGVQMQRAGGVLKIQTGAAVPRGTSWLETFEHS